MGYSGRGGFIPSSERTYDSAIADLTHAIALDGKDAMSYMIRGAAFFKKGRLDKALLDLNKSISLDAKNPNAYNERGIIYLAKLNPNKALADLQKCAKLDPNFVLAYYNMGIAYEEGNQKKDAFDAYSYFLSVVPP